VVGLDYGLSKYKISNSINSYDTTTTGSYIQYNSACSTCTVEYDDYGLYDIHKYGSTSSAATIDWSYEVGNSGSYKIRVKYKTLWCDGKYRSIIKPEDRLRQIIQSRQSPMILTSRKPVLIPQDIREVRARETLCRVIGEHKFQKFLKDGFISVRAKSGLVYQVFPGHGITAVYRDGEQIERLCVVLRGDFPPTDSLIMRYLIILNDENRFRGYAIKHQIIVKKPQIVADERSLTEIFRELKLKVA
jgi:hypothetical protein